MMKNLRLRKKFDFILKIACVTIFLLQNKFITCIFMKLSIYFSLKAESASFLRYFSGISPVNLFFYYKNTSKHW